MSFTEVEAGAHRSYNEWHLFDHLPEQYALPGIVGGRRWVLTPALAGSAGSTASPPLDRIHYVTLYLLAEPLDVTLTDFFRHGIALAKADRFHQQRTSHLAGALRVESAVAAPAASVQPGVVPFRPGTGVHLRLEDAVSGLAPSELVDAALAVPGVAGVWTFAGAVPDDGATAGLRLTCAWLDGDVSTVDAALAAVLPPPVPGGGEADGPAFAGTLAAIDPHAPFDWFD
ncbi:MAG: hypothetical protein H6518_02350 [Microthrixaceae bacterium]|nr:hypothetical protein [Microthrixaceae bacterium]